ncbi:putative membrane protein [Sphingomonas sp. F9_3S_D5_B_2]
MRNLAILLGGAIALAGCSTSTPPAEAPPPPAAVDMTNPLMAPGYLAMAASSDQLEIQSGQMAQQMSQNPQVRNFGGLLVADHTRTTQLLASTAQSAGITPPPPTLLPEHQAMLDQLRSAGSGPGFDVAFKNAQIAAHQQALQLHQNYAASGDVPALRAVAGQAVPIIQMHLNQAQMLNVNMPAPPPPPMPSTGRAGERG